MKVNSNGVEIEIVQGDITKQFDVSVIVNAANAKLKTGGGVAGAIHKAAGPELEKECLPLAPISPGEAVITKGYNLPNDYVIHCLGPVYGKDEPAAELLSSCYNNSLKIVEDNKIKSIAYPAISAGAFGYPVKEAAQVALKTVFAASKNLQNCEVIRFVLFSKRDYDIFYDVLEEILEI